MKFVITAVVSAIVSMLLVIFLMNARLSACKTSANMQRLEFAEQTVRKRLSDLSTQIQFRLKAFSDVVATNKDFSLKLLVENDRSSPEVTDIAPQFIKPMGFSALELTDSSRQILSSGHFPASAGNTSFHRSSSLTSKASATMENIRGTPTLTLQSEEVFSIAGFSFHATGGLTLDSMLLNQLKPNQNVALLLKKGGSYVGMQKVTSVSTITNHSIIINDKKYLASEIEIPSTGMDEKVSLIILVDV